METDFSALRKTQTKFLQNNSYCVLIILSEKSRYLTTFAYTYTETKDLSLQKRSSVVPLVPG